MSNQTISRLSAFALFVALSQTACAQSEAPAVSATPVAPAVSAAVAATPAQVTGLPDFTVLVEQNAGAVVNVSAVTMAGSRSQQGQGRGQEEIPEFFRRFFGPNFDGPQGGGRDRESGGSGFIISNDGYILTNNHVVRGADEVTIRLTDRRELRADVVGTDPETDIALLKVDATGLPTVRLGDSNLLKPGQWVIAIGSPFSFDHSVTAGVVSATGRSVGGGNQQYVPFIQTDVAINPGNSGGPLFNLNGEVVGINSQIFSGTGGYMGISFAIPIEVAQNVVDQLKSDGRVRRGLIGVQVQRVDRVMAESLGLDVPVGALVSQITPDGAAAKAGVEVGDVILSFNGRTINSSEDLPPVVGTVRPGTKAPMEVFRDGRRRTLEVTVGEAQSDPGSVTASSRDSTQASGSNRIGLTVQALTSEQREQLSLGADEGVLVSRVSGAAARAGLTRGDVVLRVGRTNVDSVEAFDRAVKDIKNGDSVMLLIRRGESNSFIPLTVRDSD